MSFTTTPDTERVSNGKTQRLYEFENGWGASVISGPHTYGGERGLWELAVMHDGRISYDTHITNDVLGYLTEDEVETTLSQIRVLPEWSAVLRQKRERENGTAAELLEAHGLSLEAGDIHEVVERLRQAGVKFPN